MAESHLQETQVLDIATGEYNSFIDPYDIVLYYEDDAINTIDSYGKMNEVETIAFIYKPYMYNKDKLFRRRVKSAFVNKKRSPISFF